MIPIFWNVLLLQILQFNVPYIVLVISGVTGSMDSVQFEKYFMDFEKGWC